MPEISHVCIHPTAVHSYSDVYASRQRTAYRIGKPDGSPMKMFNVSYDEAVSIVTNLPEELLDAVKAHYGLVEAAAVPQGQPAEELPFTDPETLTDEELATLLNSDEADGATLQLEGIDITTLERDELRQIAKQLEIKNAHIMGKERLLEEIEAVLDASDEEN